MIKISILLAVVVLAAITFFALFTDETDTGPSLLTSVREPAEDDIQHLIYEDEVFRFVYVDFGKGTQVPGFYVYAKDRSRWLRIDAISTTDAILGRSPTMEEARQAGVMFPAVGWNFREHYKDKTFALLPLRTSGSIVFPHNIQLDKKSQRYDLLFHAGWKTKGFKTVLRFRRADLIAELEKAPPNKPDAGDGK